MTLGVMPFADMSEAMDQEVLADNLTEDVTDALIRIPGLRTPPARTAFTLKGQGLTGPQAARRLKVDYLLDGSVRRTGETVQVTARLLRADSGFVVWSDTWRGPPAELEAAQQRIAATAGQKALAAAR